MAGIYSRSHERAAELAGEFGVDVVPDFSKLLEDARIDAVAILTEPHRHVSLALPALACGKHVLIEKPVAARLADAEALCAAAEASAGVATVISQFRYDSRLAEMKRLLDAGAVGRPRSARLRMAWCRDRAYYAAGNGWRGRYGNVLLNQAIHWLDVLLWLFGPAQEPVEARLWNRLPGIEAYDSAELRLRFKGVTVEVSATTSMPANEPLQLSVSGSTGTLRLEPHVSDSNAALELQIREFLDAARGATTPSVGPREARDALRLVRACESAAGIGEPLAALE